MKRALWFLALLAPALALGGTVSIGPPSNTSISTSGDISTTGTLTGGMSIVSVSASGDTTATTAQMYGSMFVTDNAAIITIALPAAVAGMNACFYNDNGTAALKVDPNGTDEIDLDGTAIGGGDEIDSPATQGAFICLFAPVANKWYSTGRSGTWIDGGAS